MEVLGMHNYYPGNLVYLCWLLLTSTVRTDGKENESRPFLPQTEFVWATIGSGSLTLTFSLDLNVSWFRRRRPSRMDHLLWLLLYYYDELRNLSHTWNIPHRLANRLQDLEGRSVSENVKTTVRSTKRFPLISNRVYQCNSSKQLF